MELQRRMLLTIFRKELVLRNCYVSSLGWSLCSLVEYFMNVNVWLQHLKYNVENMRQIVEILVDRCIYLHVHKVENFCSLE